MKEFNSYIDGMSIKYIDLFESRTATRFSILNIPEKWQINNLVLLAKNIIKPLFDKFNKLELTSCFRSLALNNKVGGSKTSDHILGCAIDFVNKDKNINDCDIIEWIYNNIEFKKLIIENYPNGWIHVSYDPNLKENSKILLFKDKNSKSYRKTDIDEVYKFFGKQKTKTQPEQILQTQLKLDEYQKKKKSIPEVEEQNSIFDSYSKTNTDINNNN